MESFREDILPSSESVSIFSETFTDEDSIWVTDFCKGKNIPIIFMGCPVTDNTLENYDKAYKIYYDYELAGEVFAEFTKQVWTNRIIDKNGDQIFEFAVITPETVRSNYQIFYDSYLHYIELIGIPLEEKEVIYLSQGDLVNYCRENRAETEGFMILSDEYLRFLSRGYRPESGGIELLGLSEDSPYETGSAARCVIGYQEFFNARNTILSNIDRKIYPFENLRNNVIGKTVYISPTVWYSDEEPAEEIVEE